MTTGPTQTKCQVTLSSVTSVGADGGAGAVTVTAAPECPWDASSAATWLSGLSPTSGQGPGKVEFSAAANPSAAARDGEIVVNDARVRVSQAGAACQFDLQPAALALTASGGMQSAAVTTLSGCVWTATTDVPWVQFTSAVTGSGPGTIGFAVAPNVDPTSRAGTITVASRQLNVTQDGRAPASCTYILSETTVTPDASGGTGTVGVTAGPGCPWTATSTAPWISVVAGNAGAGNGQVGVVVAPNTGGARTGTLLIAGQTFTVVQEAGSPSCTYALGASSAALPAAGGSGSVNVAAAGGCGWTASSTASWIVLTSGTTGSGDGLVSFTVAANTGSDRTGTIVAAGQTFTVTQGGAAACSYSLDKSATTVAAAGANDAVTVTAAAGCSWTAATTAPWLTVTSGASGTGNGVVTFSAATNAGGARTGTIAVAGQTVTVSQGAATPTCTFAVDKTSFSIAAAGGADSVAVTAAAGCAWAANSGAPWITIASDTARSGNGAVAFTAAPNTGGARTGTITVAGYTVTVTQAAAPPACTYAVGSTTASYAALGGTGTVGVTAGTNCTWTATSNATWITIQSGGTGRGDGSVGYTVAPNLGGTRTGTLTVAGQTVTVTQAAVIVVCTYSVAPTSVTVPTDKVTSVSVAVTAPAGCAWTARSNDGWIDVTAGASGTGNGTVAFDVEKGGGKKGRTGTLTVAGRTVTITQKD